LAVPGGEVITLCDIEGMTQSEYASLKGLTPAGVKSRIQRARKRLKQHLKKACLVRYDETGKVCGFTPRSIEGCRVKLEGAIFAHFKHLNCILLPGLSSS